MIAWTNGLKVHIWMVVFILFGLMALFEVVFSVMHPPPIASFKEKADSSRFGVVTKRAFQHVVKSELADCYHFRSERRAVA